MIGTAGDSWLEIGDRAYAVVGAEVVCYPGEGGMVTEVYSFNPLTAREAFFVSGGGMTVNGVLWPGVAAPADLAGRGLLLSAAEDPELVESVFFAAGETYEIEALELVFEEVADDRCRLSVAARLFNADSGRRLEARGALVAVLEWAEM